MNVTYDSTESYHIKKKNGKKNRGEGEGAAAVSRHQFNLVEALMKEVVASNIILFTTVPKFRSPN